MMTVNPELKVLLLDDEPFMSMVLSKILSNLGVTQVTACESGCQALRWLDLSDGSVDLILLDINMPDMDGIEFIRYLAERHYTGSLILVSGEDKRMRQTIEKLVKTHNITALGHLHKPVKADELAVLLEKWMPPLHYPASPGKTYTAYELEAGIMNGELVNYYQPKVEVANGKVIGVETLVRWRHPQDGLIFPDQFISLAEEHGLIDDLTRVVVGTAFAQAKVWQDEGLQLRVAVNISMNNLASLEFADYVSTAAIAAGITPSDIVLEITESQLIKHLSTSLEILSRLRLKRFGLSIDDFGTGHSSFSQLRDIPFNELKVDQGFVHGAASNDTLRAIYNASLSLAQQLDMKTVAEGVEDVADWDLLRSTGCNVAQGYFIAKPMPAAQLSDWIVSWEANFELLIESSILPK